MVVIEFATPRGPCALAIMGRFLYVVWSGFCFTSFIRIGARRKSTHRVAAVAPLWVPSRTVSTRKYRNDTYAPGREEIRACETAVCLRANGSFLDVARFVSSDTLSREKALPPRFARLRFVFSWRISLTLSPSNTPSEERYTDSYFLIDTAFAKVSMIAHTSLAAQWLARSIPVPHPAHGACSSSATQWAGFWQVRRC